MSFSQNVTTSYEWVCESDFIVVGFQSTEKVASCFRVVCTLITISIISSWWSRRNIDKLLLLFSHWLSGLVHQMSQTILAEMVLLCWSKSQLLTFIKAMKLFELVGGNMLAITNVAICVNLARIVSSHRTLSRVKGAVTPRLILSFWAFSVLATVAVVPFWDTVAMSGTLFWTLNTNPERHDWVLVSAFFMELIAGIIMTVIVLLLVIFRRPELVHVWSLHRHIKFYFGLTVIAIIVDLGIGIGGLLFMANGRKAHYIAVAWTMRHVHIALDTLVLYFSLGATQFEVESTNQPAAGSNSGYGSGFGSGYGSGYDSGHGSRQTNGFNNSNGRGLKRVPGAGSRAGGKIMSSSMEKEMERDREREARAVSNDQFFSPAV